MNHKKALYVGMGVIIALLLVIIVLLTVILLRGKRIKIDHGEAGKKVVSAEAKEEAFRKAVHVVDASAFPDNRESGYFETWVGDLTGDGEEEYVAFYGDFANEIQPTVDVHLYGFDHETGEAVKKDEFHDAFSIRPYNNGSVSFCVYVQDGDLCLYHGGAVSGGSMWYRQDLRFTVEDGSLKLLYHFYEYENNGGNNVHTFEERVSGETYADPAAIRAARLARGVNVHHHGVNDRNVFPEDHILVSYWNYNFDETGETGYLLLRFTTPHTGTAMPEETERETVVSTTALTTAAPATTAPPTTAAPEIVDTAQVWNQLNGYWARPEEDYFFRFYVTNGRYMFITGIFASDLGYFGSPDREITRNADGTLNLTVYCPAVQGDYEYPEAHMNYVLDLSELQNGRLNVKTDEGWLQCKYIGADSAQAEAYFFDR